ncbi:peptidoglycan-binding protein [Streptomyces bohaiensis]|uniref:peptidoglycan-binding protein n=1 Tax=Streptomyces bohaiensis TaxID=1431344 RepID=UPI003B79FE59
MAPGTSCTWCGGIVGATDGPRCGCPPTWPAPSGEHTAGPARPESAQPWAAEEAVPVRPLLPARQGPDAGDLALFSTTARLPLASADPAEAQPPPSSRVPSAGPDGPHASAPGTPAEGPSPRQGGGAGRRGRRRHRHRRASFLAGSAVAVVVGCTAVVTSVLGGRVAENTAHHDVDPAPDSVPAPDAAPPAPDEDERSGSAEEPAETAGATEPPAGPEQSQDAPRDPADGAADAAPASSPAGREPAGPAGGGAPDPGSSRQDTAPGAAVPPPGAGESPPPPAEDADPEEVERGPQALLGPGDEGAEVRALQERLTAVGDHFAVPVTGVYDEATFESVARFQEWYGVRQQEAAGVYCTVTDERLTAVLAA